MNFDISILLKFIKYGKLHRYNNENDNTNTLRTNLTTMCSFFFNMYQPSHRLTTSCHQFLYIHGEKKIITEQVQLTPGQIQTASLLDHNWLESLTLDSWPPWAPSNYNECKIHALKFYNKEPNVPLISSQNGRWTKGLHQS